MVEFKEKLNLLEARQGFGHENAGRVMDAYALLMPINQQRSSGEPI